MVKIFPGLALREKMAVGVISGLVLRDRCPGLVLGVGFTLFWALRLRYFSTGRAQNSIQSTRALGW